jgi:hypothetical protein
MICRDLPILRPALLCQLKDRMPDMNYRYVVLSNEISSAISRRHTSNAWLASFDGECFLSRITCGR